jgi:hypothetical protein
MPSYTAYLKGLVDGSVDAGQASPSASTLFELASTARGIFFPPYPASDKEGWARLNEWAPMMYPGKEDIGAGLTPGQPVEIPFYKYPQIITMAKQSEDEVYALVKAIDESYSIYKDSLPLMSRWTIEASGKTPAGVPFHKGAVKYLREKGLWTEADEKWNNERVERLSAVINAWQTVSLEAKQKNIKNEDFPKFWVERKRTLIGGFCAEFPPEIR